MSQQYALAAVLNYSIVLGSSVALNAILSASVVFLQLSYLPPILLVTIRGRRVLEPEGFPARTLKLGVFGRRFRYFWQPRSKSYLRSLPIAPIRIAASIFAIVTSVFFLLPPAIPVLSGQTMNWVVVVLAVVVLLAVVNWFVDGRKNYRGPENVDHLMARAAQASRIAQQSKGK